MVGGKKRESRVFATFYKLQAHGLNDFTGLPHNRPKRCSASLRGGELTQPYALRIPI